MADELIDLSVFARGLSVGQTRNGLECPFCGGGRSRERKFSVTRIEIGVLYHCFRDSCKRAGMQPLVSSPEVVFTENEVQVKSPAKSRVYSGTLVELPSEVEAYLETKYHLTSAHLRRGRVQWAPDFETPEWGGRVWFPTFRTDGTASGGVARSIDAAKPKTLTFVRESDLMLSWLTKASSSVAVLCEDVISGLRLARYVNAIPLLGTSLSIDKARAIAQRQYTDVYLCLDADAIKSSIDYLMQFRSILPLQVILPDKDPKDLTEDELIQFLIHHKIRTDT